MTPLGAHSTTSMAVKSVVSEVKRILNRRFEMLENFPEFFYDFDLGLTTQFKQYYAKIPIEKRNKPWIVLSYTYQSSDRSSILPRIGLRYARPVTELVKRYIDCQYVELPLLFSVLTNDSKNFNALSNYISQCFKHSFTVTYNDLLWPLWQPNSVYPLGWYIRPSTYNGLLYMTSSTGKSGESEPDWTTDITSIQNDNELSWKPLQAPELIVKADKFVKNNTTISNPIENGIMYQYDFGFTLHYTDYSDLGETVGVITEVEMNLLEKYWDNKLIDKIEILSS